jgi:hypothetical protein
MTSTEAQKSSQRKYYDKHKNEEEFKKKNRDNANKYRNDNLDMVRKKERDRLIQIRIDVLQHYSGEEKPFCNICGEDHLEFLEIDHENGGGRKHRREIKLSTIYNWLKINNYPEGYQVLCSSCNNKKERIKSIIKSFNRTKIHNILRVERSKKLKDEVYLHYLVNGEIECECCGENDKDVLTMDHIEGGGTKHREEENIGDLYQWIKNNNYPDGFRILCRNCNQSLGHRGYCPHVEEDREHVRKQVMERSKKRLEYEKQYYLDSNININDIDKISQFTDEQWKEYRKYQSKQNQNYYNTHKVEEKIRMNKYQSDHVQELKTYRKKRYDENRDEILLKAKLYRDEHKNDEEYKMKKKQSDKAYRERKKLEKQLKK